MNDLEILAELLQSHLKDHQVNAKVSVIDDPEREEGELIGVEVDDFPGALVRVDRRANGEVHYFALKVQGDAILNTQRLKCLPASHAGRIMGDIAQRLAEFLDQERSGEPQS